LITCQSKAPLIVNHLLQNELVFNEKWITATKGKITSKSIFSRGGRRIYDIKFIDPAGNKWYITIFNSWFLASKIQEGKRYIIVGKPMMKMNKIMFSHPDVIETEAPEETISEEWLVTSNAALDNAVYNSGRIFPIYSELNGISPGRFAQKMRSVMDNVDAIFHEYLPEELVKKFRF